MPVRSRNSRSPVLSRKRPPRVRLAPRRIAVGKPGHNFMDISSITGATSSQNNNSDVTSAVTQSLSQQDFLKLLVTQMTSQDPMNPTNSQDLLSQMTEFSTLNANTSMQSQLAAMQSLNQFSEAGNLLGKQITLQVDSNTIANGVVTGLDTSGSVPGIIVNGQTYSLGQVISVTNAPTTAQ
jgi:flagellar basal-body rod modification protein FlgD